MKKKKMIFNLLAICGLGAFALSSCTSKSDNPIDVIKDHYGDKQFTISFNSNNLDTPLSDILYSANNIPKLPTPERVGYRFSGWYFDSAYTMPYESDYLYTKMSDVTLYAKWEKEDFINQGIYEIEYDAKILKDTIKKGTLADKYGYLEFPNDIVEDETYIEKNQNGVFLRIQYDMHYHCPTIDDDGNMGILTYTVTDPNGRISDTESIIDRTGTIQTVYYNIEGLDISDPIYLNVEFYNWNAKLDNESDRSKTLVGYTVEFDITRFIGYTTSFVDSNDKLEDGYYLVKTHYGNLNKAATMLDTFNPVYSYIIAQNGHYKLVKPMNAYNSDIIGNLEKDDYIHLKTGYSRDICYYRFDNKIVPTDEMVDDEHFSLTDWQEYFNATEFGELTYEFHADTGKYYYVFDLGDKANVDLLLIGASSGAMTEMFNMGPTPKRLIIDYSSMVKLNEIDYTPLEGDTYSTYNTQPFYFQTDFDSLKYNTIYNAEMEYGYANELINAFYSSTSGSNVIKLHSTKMTLTPTKSTGSMSITEQKGNVLTFVATYDCYDYDPTIGYPLYGDYLNWQTFSSFAQREKQRLELGYEATPGEKIDMYQLFKSKIYPNIDEGNLSFKAYEIKINGEVDYSKELDLSVSNSVFTFNNDFALYLTGNVDGINKSGVIVIRTKESPNIEISDVYTHDDGTKEEVFWTYDSSRDVYVSNKKYYKGDQVHFPTVTYTWYNLKKDSNDAYNSDTGNYHMNQNKWSLYSLNNGIYSKISYDYSVWNDAIYTMNSEMFYAIYRMEDRYGDAKYLYFEYKGEDKANYTIECDGKEAYSGKINYQYDGTRNNLSINDREALEASDINSIFSKKYALSIGTSSYREMTLSGYTVYTRNETFKGLDEDTLVQYLVNIDYAIIDFTYTADSDSYTKSYVYGIKADGKVYSNFKIIDDIDFFTNSNYKLLEAKLMTNDGLRLSTSTINFYRYVGDYLRNVDISEVSKDSANSNYSFLKPGNYRIEYKFSFYEDEDGIKTLKDYNLGYSFQTNYRYVTVSKDIVVSDISDQITLTYVTDAKHPFRDDLAGVTINSDGSQSYSIIIDQTETNYSIDSTYFETSNDKLFAWGYYKKNGYYERLFYAGNSMGLIGVKRNSKKPVIYANWDEGITVRAEYTANGKITIIQEKRIYRGNSSSYTLVLGDYAFTIPEGYEFLGWQCDDMIFYTGSGNDKVYSYTTDSKFDAQFDIEKSCVIKAILKGPIQVRFQSYANGEYEDLPMAYVSVIEGKTLKETLNSAQLRSLHNKEKDNNFKYWAIRTSDNAIIKIDSLDNMPIEGEYIYNGYVSIVAVYGGEQL